MVYTNMKGIDYMIQDYKPEGFYLNTPENREYISSLQGLEYAFSAGLTLEAVALKCDSNHNLVVELGKHRGIIPRDEVQMPVGDEPVRDIAVITRVGKPVCFKIMALEREREGGEYVAVLSRRMAQEECFENYISELYPGDIIDAKITHMEPFGCFCDVGRGIVSLLSVDCISVSRILHPKDRFNVGQYIKAVVKEAAQETGRISLSHKELLGTWEQNTRDFSPGETAAGIVRSIEPYGIFVELTPNLAGLAEWREGVREGQSAAVYIKSIIPEKMKVKLVIVDSYNSDRSPSPVHYHITEGRITHWRYSPEACTKTIESIFDE